VIALKRKSSEAKSSSAGATVAVIGMGYVGLPLAVEFAKENFKVIGYDLNKERIEKLTQGIDYTREIGKELKKINAKYKITYTADERKLREADFVIIAVPTPVTKNFLPDLKPVESACMTAGRNLKKGAVVILESTVYPGVTEEVAVPILEQESKLKCGRDFKIGYSPERINPGDKEHTLRSVVKVVSGMDESTTKRIAELYRNVCTAGVFAAKNIKTAEAAKVIENVQRDLNIALMNELSIIFRKMGIKTKDVLAAAFTKWNFGRYYPGLVGGHCIPVDPYYLVYKAEELGYHPKVILAGRTTNNEMPKYVADLTLKSLNKAGKVPSKSNILVLGLTFKENVPDVRTSPAGELISALREYGVNVFAYEPNVDTKELEKLFRATIQEKPDFTGMDAVILTVPHTQFRSLSLSKIKKQMNPNPVLVDIRGMFGQEEANNSGFIYEQL